MPMGGVGPTTREARRYPRDLEETLVGLSTDLLVQVQGNTVEEIIKFSGCESGRRPHFWYRGQEENEGGNRG